jgi:hypothetical protein
MLEKKLIVHVTHGKQFKNKASSFYRFTNERRSLRHSMSSTILDDETMAEIQRIVSMQDEDGVANTDELRLDLNPNPSRPLVRSRSNLQHQSPAPRGGLFDSTPSPPQYHPNRNQRMTVFMSREHDSMDSVSLAIKKKKLEIQREHEERTKTQAPTRDRAGLFDQHAKVRTQTMSLSPQTESSPRSPSSPEDSESSPKRNSLAEDFSLKISLSNLTKNRKSTRFAGEKSPHSPTHPIDETSPRHTLVNFFKNRKIQKMGDRVMDIAPIITEKEKLERQVRRRSSELGGMFLLNSADKMAPDDVPWYVTKEKKQRHRKDPKKIVNRVDIFSFTSIEEVLADPDAKAMLTAFAEDEFADENIMFWDDLIKYQQEGLLSHRIEMAKTLFNTYVDPKAPMALNINLKSVQECRLIHETGSEEAFSVIQTEVLQALCDLLERLRFSIQKERISEMDKLHQQGALKNETEVVSSSYQEFHLMEGFDALYKNKY